MKKTTILFILFFVTTTQYALADFSLLSTTITQTGTDTDLSGIEGNGATKTNVSSNFSVYNKTGNILAINGTLTISPEKEQLLSSSAQGIVVNNGGHLIINGEIIVGGQTSYSESYFLISSYKNTGVNGTYSEAYACIYVKQGGRITWKGGYIQAAQPIVFGTSAAPSATVEIKKAGWNALGLKTTYAAMVRQFTNDVSVDGFKFINGGSWVDMKKPLAGKSIKGFEFNHAYGFGLSGGQYDNDWHEYRDYSAFNEIRGGGFWSNVMMRFINSANGSDMVVVGGSISNSLNRGVWEARKEIEITLTDINSNPISGAKIYIPDNNNDGFRKNDNLTTEAINYLDDNNYLFSTNATGKTDVQSILLASAVRNSGSAEGTNDSGDNKKSYRGKNMDDSDIFDVFIFNYNQLPQTTELTLKGNGVLSLEYKLLTDPNISEQNKTTVDAYTEIETSEQFYDRAKAFLMDNFTGETATIVTRTGNEINAGSHNVVIDASANSAFAFSNNTITIKATEFVGNIKTSGTLTLSNGATIFGGYEDSTGINKFVFLDWKSTITLDVEIKNLDTNTAITNDRATQTYKGHFLFPNPSPTEGIRVNITNGSGYSVYQEIIPEDDLTFIRKDVTLDASEARQNEMIFLAQKLLQKTEGINNKINGVTPSFNGTLTITNIGQGATGENQIALLALLRQILLETTASRNSLE